MPQIFFFTLIMLGYQVLIEEILIVWLISCTQWRHSINKTCFKAAFLTIRKCINTFSVTDVSVRFRVSVLPCSFWDPICEIGMWGPQRERKKKKSVHFIISEKTTRHWGCITSKKRKKKNLTLKGLNIILAMHDSKRNVNYKMICTSTRPHSTVGGGMSKACATHSWWEIA